MSRACTVCRHHEVEAINAALARAESLRSIGRAFGLTHRSLARHQQTHLGHGGVAETPLRGVSEKSSLPEPEHVHRLEAALHHARDILAQGETARDFPSAVSAIREAVAVLDAARA